jgi:hypothetical protein
MLTKKNIPALLALALLLCLLQGCGGGDTKVIDTEAMASALLDSGAFSDLLSPVSGEVARALYHYDSADVSEALVYCGTGATAEEIAVYRCPDGSAASRLRAAAEKRVAEQIHAFEDYVPAEVPKLKRADIRVAGFYVVLVISADTAKTGPILDEYMD